MCSIACKEVSVLCACVAVTLPLVTSFDFLTYFIWLSLLCCPFYVGRLKQSEDDTKKDQGGHSVSNLVSKKQAPAIKISESPPSSSKVGMIDDDKPSDAIFKINFLFPFLNRESGRRHRRTSAWCVAVQFIQWSVLWLTRKSTTSGASAALCASRQLGKVVLRVFSR